MIIDQKVEVKWNSANKDWYQSKGYTYTKTGDTFEAEINDLSKGSHSLVEFICDYCKGRNQNDNKDKIRVFKELIKARKTINKDCCNDIECGHKKAKESYVRNLNINKKTVGHKFPNLIQEWSTKNTETPFYYSVSSDAKVWWVCEFGHEWNTQIKNRTIKQTGCPYCSGKRVNIDNCIATTHPEIAKDWHPKKNIGLTPYTISRGSDKEVWWLATCGHEWNDTVSHRVHGRKCPFCSGKRVDEGNCLATLKPKLLEQWHPTKNKDLTPFDITLGSQKEAWWQCEKGHEWEAIVSSRALSDNGCPYCTGRKACADNCLATLKPILSTEWNYNKNDGLTPYDVTKNSNKIVWWTCNKCNYEWKSTVANRTNGNGCPQCKESKGEKKVRNYLKLHGVSFKSQYNFRGLNGVGGNNLKFDFALFGKQNNLILLIEYDGEYHYKKFYKDDGHERTVEHDRRKNEYCKNNNIPLLRIPYWEFSNIEEILINELNNYYLLG